MGREVKRYNLKALRARTGQSQEQFAASIGFSRCYYASVENALNNGSTKFWNAIQRVYDVPDDKMWELTKIEA